MDTVLLSKGEDYARLVPTYVIFFTEKDTIGDGLALHHYVMRDLETGAILPDERHILFVNGDYRNEQTMIGKLVHDFKCISPDEMYFDALAKRVKHFKTNEGGVTHMCKAIEDWLEVRSREVGQEIAQEIAQEMAEGMAQEMAEGMAQEMAEGMAQEMAEGMAQEMAEGMAQEMAEGMAQKIVREQSRELGILASIKAGRKYRATEEQILQDIMQEYALTQAEANRYMATAV